MNIRIDKCTDPRAWYANRVGQILPVERFEKNRDRSQGIPEDVYWCREGGTYNPINYVRASDARETITIHLVLTHHWYDETTKAGDPKRIEYRKVTPRWMRLIYDRREIITGVRFARGYTSTTAEFAVHLIDIGPCLIPGHEGERIRIHFTQREGQAIALPAPRPPAPFQFTAIGVDYDKGVRLGDATGKVVGFKGNYIAVVEFGLATKEFALEWFL